MIVVLVELRWKQADERHHYCESGVGGFCLKVVMNGFSVCLEMMADIVGGVRSETVAMSDRERDGNVGKGAIIPAPPAGATLVDGGTSPLCSATSTCPARPLGQAPVIRSGCS